MTKEEIKEAAEREIAGFPRELQENKVNTLMDARYLDSDPEAMWIDYAYEVPFDAINYIGTMHGGVVAGVMDEAMGLTSNLFAPEGFFTTTSDMQFNCLKAMHLGERLRVHTQVLHLGKRTMVCKSELWRGDELCAMSMENFSVLSEKKIVNTDLSQKI